MKMPVLRRMSLFVLLTGLLMSSCLPRCPLPSCHVRMVHAHQGEVFRGEKWYKKQNKQYGEGHKPQELDEKAVRTPKKKVKKPKTPRKVKLRIKM